jgi:hypothetical protein
MPMSANSDPTTIPNVLDAAAVRAIVDDAIDDYIASRHARVDAFVDANYRLAASLRLHKRAVGYDLLRAPANVALVLPYLGAQIAGAGLKSAGARRAGRWLATRKMFIDTDVARELGFRLHADLLELPYADGDRRCERDALAERIAADPRLTAALDRLRDSVASHWTDADARARLRTMLLTYTGARTAAADFLNNLLLAGAGASAFQQFTPGALSLGPILATAIAHQAAVAAFPLGAGLGSVWYGIFAATPSAGLVAATTAGVVLLSAVTAAFSGVVTDPLQAALGLHQRRLHRLIDAMKTVLHGDDEAGYRVRDHYVARVFDLIDMLAAAARVAG